MSLAVGSNAAPDYRSLAGVVFCSAPGLAALALGHPVLGARLYFGILCALLILHTLRHDCYSVLALIVGTIPVMMLLRTGFIYSSVIAILAAGIGVWMVTVPAHVRFLKSDLLVGALLAAAVVYWLISFALTGYYDVNLRALELCLSAACVYLLGKHRRALGTALVGIFVSTALVGLALLPSGGRLGQVTVDELSMGNPIALGLATAATLLLTVADGGRWILIPTRSLRGLLILSVSGLFLLLSTSRGSWLVVLAGFGVIFAFGRGHRLTVALAAVVLAVVLLVVLQSSRGNVIVKYVDKVLSPDRTIAQRTSGRSEQWMALPLMLRDSPIWGFGPGSERQVAYRYTGVGRTMHSFYLHIVAETGLIGFSIVAMLLVAAIARGVRHYRLTGEVTPLMAGVGFLAIGLTVSAFDAISGVYLGLAVLGARRPLFRVVVRARDEVSLGAFAHQ